MTKELISLKEAAQDIGVSRKTLWTWRMREDMNLPKYIAIGPNVGGLKRSEWNAWKASRNLSSVA